MLDIQRLADVTNGEIILLRDDRITIKHGATEIDFHQLEAFEPTAATVGDSAVCYEEADGWAWYRDLNYSPMRLVTQQIAEDLARGGSFPAYVMPIRKLKRLLPF